MMEDVAPRLPLWETPRPNHDQLEHKVRPDMTFSPRLGLCALALPILLTGCFSTLAPKDPSTIQSVPIPISPITKLPHEPVKLDLPALEAFQNGGLTFFSRTEKTTVEAVPGKNGVYRLKETGGCTGSNSVGWGTGAVGVLASGRLTDPEVVDSLKVVDPSTVRLSFKDSPLELSVKLVPYDVSGLPIRYFLRTNKDKPSDAAFFMENDKLFPAGSIAWKATLSVNKDEVFVTTKSGFTGSDTIESFSKRFTLKTPYCIGFTKGTNAQPIGLRFDKVIKKKVEGKGRKAREVGQEGTVLVWKTKRDSLFCQQDAPNPLTKAAWRLGYINGTRTLTFEFPDEITPYSLGLNPDNAGSVRIAMSEVRLGKVRQVVPSFLWLKDHPITDVQWRFNAKAAQAVDRALVDANAKVKAWKNANESELVKRSREKRR